MKKYVSNGFGLIAALSCLLGMSEKANAQFFSYSGTGDLLAGFRKTGIHQGNYEIVVNLGSVTNFLALPQGSAISISAVSPAQLADAFPDGNQDLQWSVFSAFSGVSPWATPLGEFPAATIWYTFARTNFDVPSDPHPRYALGSQANVRQPMLGVGGNASTISIGLGSTNADNNSVLVREPVSGNALFDLTSSIGDPGDPTIGNFGGQGITFTVENTTPDNFSSPTRSDFYQSCPASAGGRGGGTYIDPITGLTNGSAYLVGYFTLNPGGTMTFTRSSTNSVTLPPPPPVLLMVVRSGGTTTISFGTTNGATYTLYYTNSAGISSPVASWPTLPTTITGDGSTKSFNDASTDADRVYRIGGY